MISKDFYIIGDSSSGFQIRSKNEVIVIDFINDVEKEIFIEIVNLLNENKPLDTVADVKRLLGSRYQEENILNVLKELKDFKVWKDEIDQSDNLSALNIGREQVLFWENSEYDGANNCQEKISLAKIALIGNSRISKYLSNKLYDSGFQNIDPFETTALIDADEVNQFKQKAVIPYDFIIVDAENWSPHFLDLFNQAAYELNKPWLLIRGIDNARGSVGPLFFGKNTGCYECFQSRIKSNLEFLPYFNQYEEFLKQNRSESRGSAGPIPFYDILSSIAVLEVIKFVSEWTLPTVYKSFLTINMYTYEVKSHPFLKAPVCPVCHPKLDFKLAPWLEPIVLKEVK